MPVFDRAQHPVCLPGEDPDPGMIRSRTYFVPVAMGNSRRTALNAGLLRGDEGTLIFDPVERAFVLSENNMTFSIYARCIKGSRGVSSFL